MILLLKMWYGIRMMSGGEKNQGFAVSLRKGGGEGMDYELSVKRTGSRDTRTDTRRAT